MKKEPLCSIILPVYNSECYLNQTITSIMQQSIKDFELIIINDGSTDGTSKIIEKWKKRDRRIIVLDNITNKGVASSRNEGFYIAKGDFIALIDSDDLWVYNKLEKQLKFMYETGCDVSFTSYSLINENGAFLMNKKIPIQKISFKALLKENFVCCSSVVLKSEVVKINKMNSAYKHEDYVYWLDLTLKNVKFKGMQDILTHYRFSKMSRSFNKFEAAKGRWEIYRKYLKFGKVKAIYYFCCYAINGLKKYNFFSLIKVVEGDNFETK